MDGFEAKYIFLTRRESCSGKIGFLPIFLTHLFGRKIANWTYGIGHGFLARDSASDHFECPFVYIHIHSFLQIGACLFEMSIRLCIVRIDLFKNGEVRGG